MSPPTDPKNHRSTVQKVRLTHKNFDRDLISATAGLGDGLRSPGARRSSRRSCRPSHRELGGGDFGFRTASGRTDGERA